MSPPDSPAGTGVAAERERIGPGDPGANSDERRLVLAFQSGDMTAFDEIFRAYRLPIERLCRRYLGNVGDAEEAVQETMLRVLVGLGRLGGDLRLEAWVRRIATNVCLDLIRARLRRARGEQPVGLVGEAFPWDGERSSPPDPSQVVESLGEGREVRKVLSQLPHLHRTALVLREYEDRSLSEIGLALGLPRPKVKALLHRARSRFRRAWEQGHRLPLPPLLPGRSRGRLSRGLARFTGSVRARLGPTVAAGTSAAGEAAEQVGLGLAAFLLVNVFGAGLPTRVPQSIPRQPSATAAREMPAGQIELASTRETPPGGNTPQGPPVFSTGPASLEASSPHDPPPPAPTAALPGEMPLPEAPALLGPTPPGPELPGSPLTTIEADPPAAVEDLIPADVVHPEEAPVPAGQVPVSADPGGVQPSEASPTPPPSGGEAPALPDSPAPLDVAPEPDPVIAAVPA